ncbi:MAG TPA: flagellar motor switch protein FliN [Pirellulales bacterium]|nr:flagellar motor switch protein FliN [Pirellulales bacterium]
MAEQGKSSGPEAGAAPLKQAAGPSSAAVATPLSAPTAGAQAAVESSPVLGQKEIEALIKQNPSPMANVASGLARGTDASRGESQGNIAPGDIEFLINQAEQALASINTPADNDPPAGVTPFRLIDFSGATPSTENATLDLIRDVELDLKIELGRTHMYLEDVLKLNKGAVVPLDKLAGDPVDIYVNGRLIARGEVLILNDNFCVRVAELVAGETVGDAAKS